MNNKYEFHYVANLFPMMTAEEFNSFKEDISMNGLREPIWLFQNKIIDGRNRYLACLETNTEPAFREYQGEESSLIDFVISLNLQRRHLNTSQKACLAMELLPEIERRTKDNLRKKISSMRKGEIVPEENPSHAPKSRDVVATIFGVSGTYISIAKFIFEKSLELFNDVKKGNISLKQAKAQIVQKNEVVVKVPQSETKTLQEDEVVVKVPQPETETLQEDEVVVKVPQPETQDGTQLTKNELKKIDELVVFGMNKDKAREYVISQKRKTKKRNPTEKKEFAEVKYRLEIIEKEKLKEFAKQNGKSMSDIIRELIKNIELNH